MSVIRGLAVGVGGAAVLMVGLIGCSSDKSSEKKAGEGATATSSAGAATVSSGPMSASAGPGTATVTIDGQPKDIEGQVVCTTNGGNLNIGIGDATTGIAVVMSEDASKVNSVGLGNVDGVALAFQEGAPGGSASATKNDKTYKVSGTATGVDMANPMEPTTKPFELEVTCP